METVGILAGGIAHDLNNVLSPILLASQLIRLKNPGPEISDLVETLETSAKHGTELIKQILSFARGLEGQHIEVQVAYLIRDLQKMLKETLPRSIQLQTEIPANLWLVKGVPTHIEQVLMNLAVNAKHAMPEGGKISISAKNTVVDQSYARLHPDAKAGTYVVLSVNDTGTGMSPETLKHIYDPFFTTKPGGKGSGLGLSTVKSIVKNHGGFVHVYSEMGKGTTFRAYFPATASVAAEQVSGPQVSIPRGNGERILVVDDEAAILRVTKTMLERNGYAVETANDGAEGIATFVKHRNDIRLVITDVMMPVMDGLAMVQALLKLKSDIKVLAVSGLIESHKAAELSSVIKADILQKPFTSEELLTAVHRAMEQGAKEP
jgi:CheY-like chemotaxis protein/two-component sensor histidine kinase